MFSYHLVMILRDKKAIRLIFKFRPTIFVPHINDVGKREREYIIQLHFGKKYYVLVFFLLQFCYISCLLTCTMVQSTAASGVTIAQLCSNFYRKHANTV